MLLGAIAAGTIAGVVDGIAEAALLYKTAPHPQFGYSTVDYAKPPRIIDGAKVTVGVLASIGLAIEHFAKLPVSPDTLALGLTAAVSSALTRKLIISYRSGNIVGYFPD